MTYHIFNKPTLFIAFSIFTPTCSHTAVFTPCFLLLLKHSRVSCLHVSTTTSCFCSPPLLLLSPDILKNTFMPVWLLQGTCLRSSRLPPEEKSSSFSLELCRIMKQHRAKECDVQLVRGREHLNFVDSCGWKEWQNSEGPQKFTKFYQ